MKVKFLIFDLVVALSILLTASCIAMAQQNNDPCGCDSVLIKEHFSDKTETRIKFAYLWIITSDNYEEVKKSLDGEYIGFGKGSHNWKDFETKRKTESETKDLKFTYEQAKNIVISGIPPHISKAWLSCKQNCNTCGVTITPTGNDCDTAFFRVNWVSCAGAPPSAKITNVYVDGGDAESTRATLKLKGQIFQHNQSRTISIKRSEKKSVKFTLDMGVFTNIGRAPYPESCESPCSNRSGFRTIEPVVIEPRLDPDNPESRHGTKVGEVTMCDRNVFITVKGQWLAGPYPGFQPVGPAGCAHCGHRPRGHKADAAIVRLVFANGAIKEFEATGELQPVDPGTTVYVYMNDNDFRDNSNGNGHGANFMKATLVQRAQ